MFLYVYQILLDLLEEMRQVPGNAQQYSFL